MKFCRKSIASSLILTSFSSFCIQAQSISPQSVNSGGASLKQGNGSLSFTIGEFAVLKQTDQFGNSISPGFTNSSVIKSILTTLAPDKNVLNVQVYPNPTADMLFVDIASVKAERHQVDLMDMQGKILSSGDYAGISNRIGVPTAAYPAGTYFLQMKDNRGNLLGTYKIIKQ